MANLFVLAMLTPHHGGLSTNYKWGEIFLWVEYFTPVRPTYFRPFTGVPFHPFIYDCRRLNSSWGPQANCLPSRKGLSSNHWFSGAKMLVSGRVYFQSRSRAWTEKTCVSVWSYSIAAVKKISWSFFWEFGAAWESWINQFDQTITNLNNWGFRNSQLFFTEVRHLFSGELGHGSWASLEDFLNFKRKRPSWKEPFSTEAFDCGRQSHLRYNDIFVAGHLFCCNPINHPSPKRQAYFQCPRRTAKSFKVMASFKSISVRWFLTLSPTEIETFHPKQNHPPIPRWFFQ